MNVPDKLSILSAMINCERCDNCIARGYCNTIEKKITSLKSSMM